MVVQASGVRRLLTADQEREREALRLGRADRPRRRSPRCAVCSGVMRDAAKSSRRRSRRSRASQHLDRLIAQVEEAGLPVTLRVEGERPELSPGRRPLGVPHRAGGADERAQAREGRARRGRRPVYRRTSCELEIADDGAGSPNGARPMATASSACASASRSTAARSKRARATAAASCCARGCRWRRARDPHPDRRRPGARARRLPHDPRRRGRDGGRRRGRRTAARRSTRCARCAPTSC